MPSRPVGLWEVEGPTLSKTVGPQTAVRLSALSAGRDLPPERFLILISVRRWVNLRAIAQLEKNSILFYDLIGNRTRDLLVCSIVPHPRYAFDSPVVWWLIKLRNQFEVSGWHPIAVLLLRIAGGTEANCKVLSECSQCLVEIPTIYCRNTRIVVTLTCSVWSGIAQYIDGLRAERPTLYFKQGKRIVHSTQSRWTLGSIQLPIQWIPVALSTGVKRQKRWADQLPPSSAETKNGGTIISLPCIYSSRCA
jgi:hypothetical protein